MDKQEIKSWIITGNNVDNYIIAINTSNFHSDRQSVKISGSDSFQTEDFATVMQQISAKNYL